MSLILEALKKSEQQRRLGEAPTLGSPVVATRRRRRALPILAILIVAAGATGWWLMRPSPTPMSPTPTSSAPSAQPVQQAPAAAKPVQAPRANPAMPPRAQAQNPPARPGKTLLDATTTHAQKSDPAKRQDAPASATGTTTSGATAGPPKPVALTPPKGTDATKPASGAPPADAKQPAATAGTTPAAVPATTPAPATDKVATDKTAAIPPAPARKPAAPPAHSVPTIWELPYATRRDIPAIDLSMHVYSSDPKQRFVVIKGDRHAEGDEVGQDLTLREIRQDGMVLEYKGQEFFYPSTGR